jgi:HEPN domain-containing protein
MANKIIQTDMPFPVFSMEADTDYLLARLVNFLGSSFHSRAGFFAQQACEKYMKALSVQRDQSYAETHKLLDLAQICEPYGAFFSEAETKRILKQFDIFDQIGRYGGASNFDPLSKGQSVGGVSIKVAPGVQVAGASIWTGKHISDLDAFVFQSRGFLDFEKARFGDSLNAILNNERSKSSHLAMWRFPIPLRRILTARNAYFKA